MLWHLLLVIVLSHMTVVTDSVTPTDLIGSKDVPEPSHSYNLRCYQGRVPNAHTQRELHAQLFVAKSQVRAENSRLQLFVSYFPAFVEAAANVDIICTSVRPPRQAALTKIPCPFINGNQPEIKVVWKFIPNGDSGADPAGRQVQNPSKRAFFDYLYLENLTDADQGRYQCTATRSQETWTENWTIGKVGDHWMFLWGGDNGDIKLYKFRNSEITALPKASGTWLQEELDASDNFDYV